MNFTIFFTFLTRQSTFLFPSQSVDVVSDDDEDEDGDIVALTPIGETNKLASLDKMVCLLAILVEKSRGDDEKIHLSSSDLLSLTGSPKFSMMPPPTSTAATATSTSTSTTASASSGIATAKGLVFLYNITKDNINICQTCNLIFSLARHNPELAEGVAAMVFHGAKQAECSMNFFRLLTKLTELPLAGGPSGMPCFTSLVMHKVWDLAKTCPQPTLDWLSIQVARNRAVQNWLVTTMSNWVEQYLLAHSNQKVRSSAACLVVSLVSHPFSQAFRTRTVVPNLIRDSLLNRDDLESLHRILEFLFSLLQNARHYTDLHSHGTAKLVAYFQTMTHFLVGAREKQMFAPHFVNLWQLFHPKLSEPAIPVHHNKQALLHFWFTLCLDCPDNVKLILQNPHVTKNIAFNYILADHEDAEVVNFNRVMLPTYYGLLKMCCVQSKIFTRQLAQHQNIQWAFKNITPYYTQYTEACEELFKLMALFVKPFNPPVASVSPSKPEDKQQEDKTKTEDNNSAKSAASEAKKEFEESRAFRHQTLQLYLSTLDGRTSWNTLIQVLKILVQSNEDRLFVVVNNGLTLIYDAFVMLHTVFHEATPCHITSELMDLLNIIVETIKAVRVQSNSSFSSSPSKSNNSQGSHDSGISIDVTKSKNDNSGGEATASAASASTTKQLPDLRQVLSRWKDMAEMTTKLLTLCNSFVPHEMVELSLTAVKEMLLLWPNEMLVTLVPVLHRAHNNSHEAAEAGIGLGPFFPRKNIQPMGNLKIVRPPRPMLQMSVPSSQLDGHHGQDVDYGKSLARYFTSYHMLVDLMVRLAVNEDNLTKPLVELSAMLGLDGVPLHFQYFPKLWLDIHNTKQIDRKYIMLLVQSQGFVEYVDAVLLDERSSLNNSHVFNFLFNFFPQVKANF